MLSDIDPFIHIFGAVSYIQKFMHQEITLETYLKTIIIDPSQINLDSYQPPHCQLFFHCSTSTLQKKGGYITLQKKVAISPSKKGWLYHLKDFSEHLWKSFPHLI